MCFLLANFSNDQIIHPLYYSYLNILGKHSMKQNCSKTSIPRPVTTVPSKHSGASLGLWCPLDQYGLGLTKPTTFLRLGPPATEKEKQRSSAGHIPLHLVPLCYETPDDSSLVVSSLFQLFNRLLHSSAS